MKYIDVEPNTEYTFVVDYLITQKGAGRLQLPGRSAYRPAPRVRDVLRTYFSAVRMMFLPMLVVIGFIAAAFLIVSLIFWLL